MASPNEFARRLDVIAAKIEDGANKIVRKAALAVDAAVVTATPVDTGRARSNWIATVDKPNHGTVETYGGGAAQSAIAQAGSVIAVRRFGQVIWISNNLAYIDKLNKGHSKQAPAGFFERAALVGRRIFRKARLLD